MDVNPYLQSDVDAPGRKVVAARHSEYMEFVTTWRWLADSHEGGERYREADYGPMSYVVYYQSQDTETGRTLQLSAHHNLPRHNLIRHPQEYPTAPGPADLALEGAPSTGDEFEFRRALTPVPSFVSEAISAHLSRIYAREVKREAPAGPAGDALRAWWADVDGTGSSIDDWMAETIAPLFLALGQLDLAFDHPPAPDGEAVGSQADAARLGLTKVVASYILPENLTDWDLAPDRCYARCVVREWDDAGKERYREWTPGGWTLYDARGRPQGRGTHDYGRVPVTRAFDVRKARCDNVGQSRYEVIAEIQRTFYNVDSELTLSNSLAAHALLSGPEDYCNGNAIQAGPGNVLPMRKNSSTGSYQGWEYVCPPSDAADKLRHKLQDLRDAADRAACLTKPAGARGTGGQTVSQSGVSKMMDEHTGNDLLAKISKALQRLERRCVEMVLMVAGGKVPTPEQVDAVEVVYPTRFDLFSAGDFSGLVAEFQTLLAGVDGVLPETFGHLFRTWARLALPGLDDDSYKQIDDELEAFLKARADEAGRRAEAGPAGLMPPGAPGVPGPGKAPPQWQFGGVRMPAEALTPEG
jgi:hypothetical protein